MLVQTTSHFYEKRIYLGSSNQEKHSAHRKGIFSLKSKNTGFRWFCFVYWPLMSEDGSSHKAKQNHLKPVFLLFNENIPFLCALCFS
jgi:hypothetical protein